MVYLILTSTYPFKEQEKAEKAFMQAIQKNPTPSYIKPVVPLAVRAGRSGIKTMAVYEIEKGKVEDAMAAIAKALLEYYDIEGYRYEINTWMTMQEAFGVIGKKAPE